MKKLFFIPIIVFIATLSAMKKPVKRSKPAFMTVETPKAIFKIPVNEKTTALQIKQQIAQLQGTTIRDQRLKRRSTWCGFRKQGSELKNHEKIFNKRSNPNRLSLCMSPKKKDN